MPEVRGEVLYREALQAALGDVELVSVEQDTDRLAEVGLDVLAGPDAIALIGELVDFSVQIPGDKQHIFGRVSPQSVKRDSCGDVGEAPRGLVDKLFIWIFESWLPASRLRCTFASILTLFDEQAWSSSGYRRSLARVYLPVRRAQGL